METARVLRISSRAATHTRTRWLTHPLMRRKMAVSSQTLAIVQENIDVGSLRGFGTDRVTKKEFH